MPLEREAVWKQVHTSWILSHACHMHMQTKPSKIVSMVVEPVGEPDQMERGFMANKPELHCSLTLRLTLN